jgi:hypothetical protein
MKVFRVGPLQECRLVHPGDTNRDLRQPHIASGDEFAGDVP